MNANVTATATTAAAATAAPATPKAPSKTSQASAIFAAAMADRAAGKFDSNKAFRAAVLRKIESDLSVTTASAATMYNACKKAAETADATVGLGRDPKKVKVKVEGAKRGRPAKAKAAEGEAATAATTEANVVVITTEAAPVEAAASTEPAAA